MTSSEKKNNNHKYSSITITLIVIFLLILAGPTSAVTVSIINLSGTETVYGTPVTFSVNITIDGLDKYVPISNLSLDINGPITAEYEFSLDGSQIINNNIAVTPISIPTNAYGNGTRYGVDNNDSGHSFGYGFGYGNNSGAGGGSITYSYNVTFTNFPSGNYNVIANLNTGDLDYPSFSSSSASFKIVPVTTPEITSSGSGGGGGSTGEKFENIEVKEVIRVDINRNSTIVYKFKEEINAIDFIKFDAKISVGYIAATIEVLKNTSALVSTAPSGEVYQNMNIWISDISEEIIANPIIEFKVTRSWITENNIDISKIQLCRYSSGIWNPLPTTKINEDEKYIYFISKTPGFSPFAITGTKISNTPIINTLTENMPAADFTTPSTLTDDVNAPVSETAVAPDEEEDKTLGVFALAIGLIGISILVVGIVIKREKTKEWIGKSKELKEKIKEWIDKKMDSSWDWDWQ